MQNPALQACAEAEANRGQILNEFRRGIVLLDGGDRYDLHLGWPQPSFFAVAEAGPKTNLAALALSEAKNAGRNCSVVRMLEAPVQQTS